MTCMHARALTTKMHACTRACRASTWKEWRRSSSASTCNTSTRWKTARTRPCLIIASTRECLHVISMSSHGVRVWFCILICTHCAHVYTLIVLVHILSIFCTRSHEAALTTRRLTTASTVHMSLCIMRTNKCILPAFKRILPACLYICDPTLNRHPRYP